jgi:hypothetical protein
LRQAWNPVTSIRRRLIHRLAGQDLIQSADLEIHCQELEQELAGPHSTAIERVLAATAATCWLASHVASMESLDAPRTVENVRYLATLESAAHKRFMQSLRTLAVVRKLALPVLLQQVEQLNINVANMQEISGTTAKKLTKNGS